MWAVAVSKSQYHTFPFSAFSYDWPFFGMLIKSTGYSVDGFGFSSFSFANFWCSYRGSRCFKLVSWSDGSASKRQASYPDSARKASSAASQAKPSRAEPSRAVSTLYNSDNLMWIQWNCFISSQHLPKRLSYDTVRLLGLLTICSRRNFLDSGQSDQISL